MPLDRGSSLRSHPSSHLSHGRSQSGYLNPPFFPSSTAPLPSLLFPSLQPPTSLSPPSPSLPIWTQRTASRAPFCVHARPAQAAPKPVRRSRRAGGTESAAPPRHKCGSEPGPGGPGPMGRAGAAIGDGPTAAALRARACVRVVPEIVCVHKHAISRTHTALPVHAGSAARV
jgi:hypothetical protein